MTLYTTDKKPCARAVISAHKQTVFGRQLHLQAKEKEIRDTKQLPCQFFNLSLYVTH